MSYIETLHDQVNSMATGFVQTLPSLAISLAVLTMTWVFARFAVRIANRLTRGATMRESLKQLVQTLIRLGIWLVGIMIALTVALPDITPASLFAGLGFGAVAIGFAFQDIFENFLAGVLIMIREKMRIGDIIECEGIVGKVEHISLRETHIRQLSNELTVVPNSLLFKNPVKILTDQDIRRDELVVGVAYDTDLERAQTAIRKAIKTVEFIREDRPIEIYALEFNASSVDFHIRWWSETGRRDLRETKSHVVFAIKRALDDAGIEIPFPYVTHTFKEPLPLSADRARAA